MRAVLNVIDSDAAGFPVIDVTGDPKDADMARFEREQIALLNPRVVFLSLAANDVSSINNLERLGFEYAETQLGLSYRIPKTTGEKDPGFRFESVGSEAELEPALQMAAEIFSHDRFTTDHRFDRSVSGRRYQSYVRQSFSSPDESVFVMRDQATRSVVSFATIRDLGGGSIRLLLGGVANKYKGSGLGVIHDRAGLQAYALAGYRKLVTAVSAINTPIINLEVGHLGFRVDGCRIILKKWYTQ